MLIATSGWGPADSGQSSQMTTVGDWALESAADPAAADPELEAEGPSLWNSRSEAAWGRSPLGAGSSLKGAEFVDGITFFPFSSDFLRLSKSPRKLPPWALGVWALGGVPQQDLSPGRCRCRSGAERGWGTRFFHNTFVICREAWACFVFDKTITL